MMRKCLFHGEEATEKVGGTVYEKRYGWNGRRKMHKSAGASGVSEGRVMFKDGRFPLHLQIERRGFHPGKSVLGVFHFVTPSEGTVDSEGF